MLAVSVSPAEGEVMRVLWEKAPRLGREIAERLAVRKSWKPSTSRTLLRRLVRKGAVKVHKRQRPFLYEPCVNQQACARFESRSLLQRWFGGRSVELLANLLSETSLTPQDIQRLQRILSRKRTRERTSGPQRRKQEASEGLRP